MNGFVKLNRSVETMELLETDPNAFLLLALIALRARWSSVPNRRNLQPGQCLLGDHAKCGLTQKEYRTAKNRLESLGYVAFKGTNKGTVATILSTQVYDVNLCSEGELRGNPAAGRGQAKGGSVATNEERKNGKNEEKEYSPQFLEWWAAYPRKEGKRPSFIMYEDSLSVVSADTLLAGVRRYCENISRTDVEATMILYPEKWLKDRRWEDEY
ncbi:MAG: hypothetical protein PHP93_00060 [Kiritimatiellales bacterium]|nr:hypothetical protein [Kiritimatiellales bacterium]